MQRKKTLESCMVIWNSRVIVGVGGGLNIFEINNDSQHSTSCRGLVDCPVPPFKMIPKFKLPRLNCPNVGGTLTSNSLELTQCEYDMNTRLIN